MIACEHLTGRMRQICEGVDSTGKPIDMLPMDRVKYLRSLLPGESDESILLHVHSAVMTSGKMKGLGDLVAAGIKLATFGLVQPCGGCSGRKEKLNKLVPFTGRPVATRITAGMRSGRASFTPPLIGVPINRDRLRSHILYHVMPLSGDTEWVWRRHCDWLREVRQNFNGRLIIGIVTPGQDDAWSYCPAEAAREALSGLDAEFIEAPNDTGSHKNRKHARQGKGEGVLFPQMLAKLQTSDPDQVAFYGHCKGVTRPQTQPEAAIHKWAEAMFETLFRNHDSAVAALDTHGVCGPFRMRGGYRDGTAGIGSNWFFSGTFFASRLVDVFSRKWEYLPTHYGCVEQWPRLNFDQQTQAACLFFDNVTNLYDEAYWTNTITPAFEKWRQER